MKPFILPLSDTQADLETTGGKGASLARMLSAGLPVPGGFHVTTSAYRCFVQANDLQAKILAALTQADPADPTGLEVVSQTIGQLFLDGQIPAEIRTAVSGAYTSLGDVPVAVRSSATAEDLPDASFAGQQETYLNIRGTEAVLQAMRRCWASLWTARAIAYRLKNNIDQDAVALAVVVQELVFADAAGILFTANPINGSRDELVINAAWGLGEAVVSGAVTPDTLTVNKQTGKVVRREIAEKLVMTVRTAAGTEETPVPIDRRKQPVLTVAQIRELTGLAVRIEQFYGRPMDVEWALAGGQFAIVQARPITVLPLEWKAPEKGVIYARGSLAEHTPSPLTPLFATLGLKIANQATGRMWERMLGSRAQDLMAGDGFYMPINGYMFGGVRMQGKALWSVIRMSISQMGPVFRGSVQRWQAARQELAGVVAEWEQRPIETFTAAELLEGVRVVFGAACRYFTEIQTTLPAASMSEVFFTRLYTSLIRRRNDPEATHFLLGFETTSLRAEKSLYDLAQWLREDPGLNDYICQTATEQLVSDLPGETPPAGLPAEQWAAWRDRFHRHLTDFGRTAYEFDFVNPTPYETPGPMLDAIKSYVAGQAGSPYDRQREAVAHREQATQAVLQRVGWPRRGWFEKLLRWAQETGPMREDSIFDMGMGHLLVRRMLNELGRRLVAGGAIGQVEEIYWLEETELLDLVERLDRGQPLPDLCSQIDPRRAQWQAYRKVTPPVMLPERSGWKRLVHGGDAQTQDGKVVLKGVGTSSGTITAPACVLFGPEDFGKIKPGDVLVAVTTTPAWTPLFAMASAVVTDIGGPLSHSSIVAREYGIPAVMATRTGTRLIQTGQLITVDGTAGTVIIEKGELAG